MRFLFRNENSRKHKLVVKPKKFKLNDIVKCSIHRVTSQKTANSKKADSIAQKYVGTLF